MVKFACIKNKESTTDKIGFEYRLKNKIKYIATAIVINNFFKWERMSSFCISEGFY